MFFGRRGEPCPFVDIEQSGSVFSQKNHRAIKKKVWKRDVADVLVNNAQKRTFV